MTEHDWLPLPTVEVATCPKCGLLRVKTISGEFLFVHTGESHLQCTSPYWKDEAPCQEPKP